MWFLDLHDLSHPYLRKLFDQETEALRTVLIQVL